MQVERNRPKAMRVKVEAIKFLDGEYSVALTQENEEEYIEHDLGVFSPDEIKLLIEDLKEVIFQLEGKD